MAASRGRDEVVCRYYRKPGKVNTRDVLEAAGRRAGELGIKMALIPSVSGETALAAVDVLGGASQIIAITHVAGFGEPNVQEMGAGNRMRLESAGVRIFTGQHAFGGVGRAVRNKLGTYQVDEIMAFTLRTFGQGTKVAVEIALMAADAGLVRTDEDIISTGGTGKGVDTALVIRPSNSFRFFELKVREVICKPREF
ncbi:MAG TPA: pyruvate kinase alpha/beta domain-containing protein [Syntrophales bacterium]|nr:pyruvate kinase alpha/beta domain-containing protein [Syntrophales bacterium]